MVLQNQDLNLTGIIGSGEKPKLEQIFTSLRVSEEIDDQIREDTNIKDEERKERGFWRAFKVLGIDVLKKLQSIVFGLPIATKTNTIARDPKPALTLFRSSLFWRMRLVLIRNEIRFTFFAILPTLFLFVIPIYGLFFASDINNFAAGYGTAVWSLIAIIGIQNLTDDFRDLDNWKLAGIFTGLPSIAIGYVFIIKVVLEHQSPLAMGIGAALVLLPTMSFICIDRSRERRRKGEERTAKEVGKLISSHENLAILGKPGAGKSTYVQFIALTFAQEKAGESKIRKPGIVRRRFGTRQWFLPILIPLRKISRFLIEADPKCSENLLIEAFRQQILPSDIREILPSSYVLYLLCKRRCLFLLDGLDEVADDVEFQTIVKEIMGLVSRFPGNKFIVTSRYAGWRGGLGSSFRQFEIEDLNDEEITEFINSWYRAIEENRAHIAAGTESPAEILHRQRRAEENANKLRTALKDVKSIRSLAENPLLLSIICFVHYHKTLPKERLSLYQDCSNLLLVQWDREKGLPVDDTNLTLTRKEAIMQEIAFSMHSGRIGARFGRKEAIVSEIVPIVESMLKRFQMDPTQATTLFQKLIDRSGIIVVVEQFTDRYAFSHLTLQEFYAAKYLHENHLDLFDTIGQLPDGSSKGLINWWREVVLLYSVMQRNPTRIIETLCREDEMDLIKPQLQIAAQCLSEAVEVPNHEVEMIVLSQLLHIRSNGNETSRTCLFQPELKDYLLSFARNADFYKYVLSTRVRKVRRVEEAIDLSSSLIQMANSVDSDIKLASVEALYDLGQKYNISQTFDQETLERLLSNPNTEVQQASIQLILSVLPKPISNDLSKKLVDTTLTLLAQTHKLPEFIFSPLSTRIDESALCLVLQETICAISVAERINIQQHLVHKLYQTLCGKYSGLTSFMMPARYKTFYFWPRMHHKPHIDLIVCVAKALIQLDNNNQRSMHKRQLLDALNKGTPDQQIKALLLLTNTFGSESDIVDSILMKLESPFGKVRLAALSALQNLELSIQQLHVAKDALVSSLEGISMLRWIHCHLRQIIARRGCLGIDQEERIRIIETLLTLKTSWDKSVLDTLLSSYQKLLPRSRWITIKEMPKEVISKLSQIDIGKIVRLYEQDLKEKGSDWPSYDHIIAIETLGNLSDWYDKEVKKKVSSILFDLIHSESDEVSLAALRSLDKLRPIIVAGSEQHQLLLLKLKSKQQSVADLAFDILLSYQLV